MNNQETILSYLSTRSRNKIVIFRENIAGIELTNIGLLLSEAIFNLKNTDRLSIRATNELEGILQKATYDHAEYGKILAITNIGILLEPDLKIDFMRLLDRYSQNNALFLHWEGDIDNEHLYFLSKENGIKIKIKNLSHLAL